MAYIIDKDPKKFPDLLTKKIQSGNINFLFGAGASMPAIPVAGELESEAVELIKEENYDEANKKFAELLNLVNKPTNLLIADNGDGNVNSTLLDYKGFLRVIEKILIERKTTLLPKQATIFTTNYDLFIERASEIYDNLILNDGFNRKPNINNEAFFDPSIYFRRIYHQGPLYGYKAEMPIINLVKLHGSLNWKETEADKKLLYRVKNRNLLNDDEMNDPAVVSRYLDSHNVVLPRKDKFYETVMSRTYYSLLRIFSNEMDKENTLLVSFGFSFNDEHIFELTERALRNPSLTLLLFSFDYNSRELYQSKFQHFSNVLIYSPEGDQKIRFSDFINLFVKILPDEEE